MAFIIDFLYILFKSESMKIEFNSFHFNFILIHFRR